MAYFINDFGDDFLKSTSNEEILSTQRIVRII